MDKEGKLHFPEDSGIDIREWQPGEFEETFTYKTPRDFAPQPKGTFQLGLAILDPATYEPAVELVADAEEQNKWYLFGSIDVK